jgi:hypothetical protein
MGFMKRHLLALAAAVLGCCAISTASNASVITPTWEGTVGGFTDTAGVFGTPGGDLAGDNYKLVFTVDTSQGDHFSSAHSDGQFNGISATLTINGHDYSIVGDDDNGSYDLLSNGDTNIGTHLVFSSIFDQVGSLSASTFISISLGSNGTIPGFPGSIATAYATSTCPAGGTCGGTFYIGHSLGTLNFGSYSVSATPIPATLPLFISALGGLGFVGWRRRKMAA